MQNLYPTAMSTCERVRTDRGGNGTVVVCDTGEVESLTDQSGAELRHSFPGPGESLWAPSQLAPRIVLHTGLEV